MSHFDTRIVKDESNLSSQTILMRNIRDLLTLTKPATPLLLGAALASLGVGRAQTLYDHFSGTQINTDIWQVQLPFSPSSVTRVGGLCDLERARAVAYPLSLPGFTNGSP